MTLGCQNKHRSRIARFNFCEGIAIMPPRILGANFKFHKTKNFYWRGGRAAEGAPLLRVYRLIPYRGFESLSLRHM